MSPAITLGRVDFGAREYTFTRDKSLTRSSKCCPHRHYLSEHSGVQVAEGCAALTTEGSPGSPNSSSTSEAGITYKNRDGIAKKVFYLRRDSGQESMLPNFVKRVSDSPDLRRSSDETGFFVRCGQTDIHVGHFSYLVAATKSTEHIGQFPLTSPRSLWTQDILPHTRAPTSRVPHGRQCPGEFRLRSFKVPH